MGVGLDKAGTIAALAGVPISLAATGIAFLQLSSSINSVKVEIDHSRDLASMTVVETYLSSPELIEAKKIINEKTSNGTDYSTVPTDVGAQLSGDRRYRRQQPNL
jgi:hypothetical protein